MALRAVWTVFCLFVFRSAYLLKVKEAKKTANEDSESKMIQVVNDVVKSFDRCTNFQECENKLEKRMRNLENVLLAEANKLREVETCKTEIAELKEHLQLLPSVYTPTNSGLAPEMITLARAMPEYSKMLSLLEYMFHELGLVEEFLINTVVLRRWLLCVRDNYRNNPFHNFRHCFCVTQMMYGIIHMCKLWEKVSREDLGIMITACICHDLDHPGYSNTYQINARTELAVRYNDISPLENHHCAIAFQILSNPETNIFGNVSPVTFKRIRLGLITLILATDMATHNNILQSFKLKLESFDFNQEDHITALKMVLIKCCDISNEVRPFQVSEPWVDCLLEEYFNQSDIEKEKGLPVAAFMDREKVTKPAAQIGFIKFVLLPMFETVAMLFPEINDHLVQQLREALKKYQLMKTSNDKPKKAEADKDPEP